MIPPEDIVTAIQTGHRRFQHLLAYFGERNAVAGSGSTYREVAEAIQVARRRGMIRQSDVRGDWTVIEKKP